MDQRYTIITEIEEDAPYGDYNWFTVSFLTPEKIESINQIGICGMKIHNAYTNLDAANADCENLKKKNKAHHDVFLGETGKRHGWDDSIRVERIEYNDSDMEQLEKKRREIADRSKLVTEQMNNEHKNAMSRNNQSAAERMRAKLHARGILTKQELEKIHDKEQTKTEIILAKDQWAKINKESKECESTDYLDANEPVGLKWAIVSLFNPKHIHNLNTKIFKIRGFFANAEDAVRRGKALELQYPKDPIVYVEIGKWCPFNDIQDTPPAVNNRLLNYAMKCHIDNLKNEAIEFQDRIKKMREESEKCIEKAEKKRNKRRERKARKQASKKVVPDNIVHTADDLDAITAIADFINDDDTKDRFAIDESQLESDTILAKNI